ncbi:MAG: Potassium channel [Ignavibacteria bacterium]|nr:Potassium channel [Ignavibacteria bacterium]
MTKNRLEAFSDGVLAIIITIMVLELKIPHGSDWESLRPVIPVLLCYIMSFIYVAIYWNNHHHMIYTVKKVSGGILWANMHLLFWLSLIPFTTGWMGENHFTPLPVALYGVVLLMSAAAYIILQKQIIKKQGNDSVLKNAIGKDLKGYISLILYLIAIPFSFITTWVSEVSYFLVAMMWLIPDKRIEKNLDH